MFGVSFSIQQQSFSSSSNRFITCIIVGAKMFLRFWQEVSFEREYSDSIKQRVKGGEEDNVSPTGLPQV